MLYLFKWNIVFYVQDFILLIQKLGNLKITNIMNIST